MNFDHIDVTLGKNVRAEAQRRFQGLTLELGVREDNEHVGSGLGGNNAQLYALMSLRNELINDPGLTVEVKGNIVRWGSNWLRFAKRTEQRHELDTKLPLSRKMSLEDVRADARFAYGPNVANLDLLAFACQLCADLAKDLDNGIELKVRPVALALGGFPMETVLVAVRRYIQIERLVRHNLDEHKDFGKVLTQINKQVDN